MELVIPNLQIPYQAIKSRGTEQEIQLTSFTLIDSDTVSQSSINTAQKKQPQSWKIYTQKSPSQQDQQDRTRNRTATESTKWTKRKESTGIWKEWHGKKKQMGTFKGNVWIIRIWTFMTSHVTIQSIYNQLGLSDFGPLSPTPSNCPFSHYTYWDKWSHQKLARFDQF